MDSFVVPRHPQLRSSCSRGERPGFRGSHQSRSQSGQPPSGRQPSRPFKGRGAVGRFTPEQLQYWTASTPDAWVLATLSQGYRLQLRRRPPVFGRLCLTYILEPVRSSMLDAEIATLLDKGAIGPVDPWWDPGCFILGIFPATVTGFEDSSLHRRLADLCPPAAIGLSATPKLCLVI